MVQVRGRGNAPEIAGILKSEVVNSGLSCELVESVERAGVYVLVFEKYYMRNSSRASLTVVISSSGDVVTVDAIGSGGGQGALFSFSWGAEENFAQTVADILEPHGFR